MNHQIRFTLPTRRHAPMAAVRLVGLGLALTVGFAPPAIAQEVTIPLVADRPEAIGLPSIDARRTGPFFVGQTLAEAEAVIAQEYPGAGNGGMMGRGSQSLQIGTLTSPSFMSRLRFTSLSKDGASIDEWTLHFTSLASGKRVFQIWRVTVFTPGREPAREAFRQSLEARFSPATETQSGQEFFVSQLFRDGRFQANRATADCGRLTAMTHTSWEAEPEMTSVDAPPSAAAYRCGRVSAHYHPQDPAALGRAAYRVSIVDLRRLADDRALARQALTDAAAGLRRPVNPAGRL